MTKKSLSVLLVLLLLCTDSGTADVQRGKFQHFDHLNEESDDEVFGYHDDKAVDNKLANPLIICATCKKITVKIITAIGDELSKDEINQKIDTICRKIRIPGCTNFVQKYKNKLVTDLLDGDNARAICIKLKLCEKYMQTI